MLLEKTEETMQETITFTKEDFTKVKDRFLYPCPVTLNGGYNSTKTHSAIYISTSSPVYEAYEEVLKASRAKLLANIINPNSGKQLRLWFEEFPEWNKLSEKQKNEDAVKASSAGSYISEYSSFCSCCGVVCLTNPMSAMYYILQNYYAYSYILISDTVLKQIKSCKLKDYLTFEFTYERGGKSFSIISFREPDVYQTTLTKIYALMYKLTNGKSYSTEQSVNEKLANIGININDYLELVGYKPSDTDRVYSNMTMTQYGAYHYPHGYLSYKPY